MRVLLVEDDELLGDGIATGLKQYGYTVDWLKDGQSAYQALTTEHFDTVVLDLGLPKRSGLDVLMNIRKRNVTTPVVILTARDSIDERVEGLDAGADDYITKPFDLDELCARLRALQRRSKERATPTLSYDRISLDPASRAVTLDGNDVELSRREFALLKKLLESIGRVISRDQLTQSLYGWGDNVDSNALEVHIHNIRKKFGTALPIRTVRGVGYVVEKEGTEANKSA